MNKLILRTDSYKTSHFLQFPPGTEGTNYYFESRGGAFPETVFFGLQYILREYLSKPITREDVDYAEKRLVKHGVPFNRAGWDRIVDVHGGFIPMRIRAVPEGSVVPVHNALMTVESTDPQLPWIPGYFETLLERVWYPTTVATLSHFIRRIIKKSMDLTSDDPEGVAFKLHDFGARGVSSAESAALGDCAHLVSFMGTDTVEGLEMALEHYFEDMAGFSIPAAEHSTITSWGRENEAAAFSNMLKQFAHPGSLVAVVSDSYDLWNAIDNLWGRQLRQQVIDSGATVVVRPDSGDPVQIVLSCLQRLDAAFGHTVNSKGYRVLNHVRVIQGDGVNISSIGDILGSTNSAGYATTNVAFGSGGALLQKVDRDTQKFAYKCCEATVAGVSVPVFKDPVTDPGKRSKSGRLDLVRHINGEYRTVQAPNGPAHLTVMKTVFEDGRVFADDTLKAIRERAASVL